ncbi:MAG: DNA polymerase, partial [Patescibacteria group bacterium]
NFGIIYGMGVYGLAQDAGISRQEAKEFMEKYFNLYKSIGKYIEDTKSGAREKGYVETLFGRVRYIPDINSGVMQVRNAAERMAINMPIQGTAADIIKLAMIKIQEEIDKGQIKAKMTLQVHDELVFEVKDQDVPSVSEQVKKIMEGIYKLRCPIEVHINVGDNWDQAK